jgi:hypothetical protein
MPKKPVKTQKSSDIEKDLKEIIERKKSENQALHKLLQFVEKGSREKNMK